MLTTPGLLEQTASVHGEARIVMVSSNAYKISPKLDYKALTTRVEKDGDKVMDLKAAFGRYGTSKLANIYYAGELDQILRAKGITKVYCNSCHPGMSHSKIQPNSSADNMKEWSPRLVWVQGIRQLSHLLWKRRFEVH
jgi:NAD(P)-dependent dehydrogenase (short-subunit alcohol dehydrogenase family)